MDKKQLGDALETLNPENDNHWTTDGAPKLEALETIMGEKVKRADVTKMFPLFTREVSQENAIIAKAEIVEASDVETDIGDALHDAVDLAEEALNLARKNLDSATISLGITQEHYANALKARDDAYPPLTNTENIREFLDEQHRQRIARFAGSFIKKEDAAFLAKAPVDKAFAAKRNRGTRRPVHPRVARQG